MLYTNYFEGREELADFEESDSIIRKYKKNTAVKLS